MNRKVIRLISLGLAAVMAASAIVYVSADEQEGFLGALFTGETADETALSDSALETEAADPEEDEAGETAEEASNDEASNETEGDTEEEAASNTDETDEEALSAEEILSGSALDAVVKASTDSAAKEAEEVMSGSFGDDIEYVLYDDGSLDISGSGNIDGSIFSYTDIPWYEEAENITYVDIEDGITGIGAFAFYGCSALEEIYIPDSVEYIGSYAFYNCSSLTEISLPDSVTFIGNRTFYGCSSLTGSLPDGIIYVGDYAFYNCSSLTDISLSDDITGIGQYAFYGCSSLGSITIPDSITYINQFTFYGCSSLPEIIIPDSVTYIGIQAFAYCSSLTEITISNSVTSIGSSTFAHCSSLPEIIIPDSVTSIGAYAFSSCTSLAEITIPGSITSISNYTFTECTSLTKAEILSGVESIGSYAFSKCTSLTEIAIPDSVTSIGNYAFWACTAMPEITIPDSITSIGIGAFTGCTSLVSITIPSSIEEIANYTFSSCTSLLHVEIPSSVTYISSKAFNSAGMVILYVEEDSYAVTYAEENGYTYIIGKYNSEEPNLILSGSCGDDAEFVLYDNGKMVISGTGAMTSYSNSAYSSYPYYSQIPWLSYKKCVQSVIIESGITYIGDYIFYDCSLMTDITIPDSVTTIGGSAFYDCTSLTEITIPDSVTAINSGAFYFCESLAEITIPDSVTSMGGGLFYYCESLAKVVLPNNITSISESTFYGCKSLPEITIPDSVTSISDSAFCYCTSLPEITIPDSVTYIGNYAFRLCTSLPEIIIPDSVINIGNYVFQDCTALTKITIPDSVAGMGSGVFYGCESLTEITIPDGITSIGYNTFYGCESLTKITMPDSITSIGSEAFSGCTSLTEITIHYNVLSIEDDAFDNSGLETVYCYQNSAADDTSLYPEGTELIYLGNASETILISGSCGDNASYVLYADGTLTISGTGVMAYYSKHSAVPWDEYRSFIKSASVESGITSIGNYAFYGCSLITEFDIPDTVTSLGEEAFYNCSSLTKIEMPDSVNSLGTGLFYGCKSLADVRISNSVTSMLNASIFRGCTSLTSIVIPDAVTKIGESTFESCTSLKSVTLSESLKSVGYKAFYKCTALESIIIPENVTVIDQFAFYNCTSLSRIDISDSVTSINYAAFYNCTSLTTVTIPDSVTSLGTYAFYCCSGITKFYVPESVSVTSSTTIEGFAEGATVYCYAGTAIYTYAAELGYNVYDLGEHEHEYENFAMSYSCTEQGYAGRTCWICGYTIIDEYFGGEGHKFGDWVVESEATVFSGGYKYRECSVCGDVEEVYTDKIEVDIETDENYGLANFTVVDAGTLEPISGASMYITTENDGEGTVYFGSDGTASVVLPVGRQLVTVSAEGYSSRSLNVTIVSGEQDIAKIGLGTGSFVEGVLNVNTMTMDEIIDAGIDVDAEDNSQIYKYTVTFEFGEYTAYFSENGTNYSEPQTFISGGVPVKVTALSEHFYLVITGEVKWLKEMFDVQLLVINNSATDTIENCVAELVLPEGLSLADMTEGEQSLLQTIDYVEEGGTDTIHWYVRGDEEGEYDISAKLDGQLMPFEEAFSYEYTTDEPVRVYAGSALQMTIKAPGATYYNDDYTVTLELENVSDRSIYNLTHTITSLEQFKAVTYSDGHVIEEAYVDTDTDKVTVTTYDEEGKIIDESETTVDAYVIGSASADEFKPGDKLVIEVTSNIMFEGSRLTAKGAELVSQIEEAQKILDAYNAVTAGSDILNSAYNMLAAAESNMSGTAAEDTKGEAYTSLSTAVNKLLNIVSTGSSTALEMVERLEKAGIYAVLTEISQDASYYENHTEEEISGTLKVMDAIMRSCDDEEFETYSVFNILKATAESIPVSFILQDVFVNTLEGSTTEIPCVIEITAGDYPVSYSVSAVGSYLYSILSSAMGSDVPRYVDIFGGSSSSYDDVLQHVIMKQNSTSTLAAESATGNAAFKAWVENSDGNISSAYGLASDNETASVSADGVLSFTGSGFISVVPSTSEGGTLYVEMTENGETSVKTYAVDVVSAHSCSSDEWVSVVEPTEDSDGYMVKVCDVCGDVIDIKTTALCANHTFGSYVVEVEPTEDEYGLKVKTCEVCGYKHYSVIGISDTLELTEDSAYSVDEANGFVTGVSALTSIADFMANFENDSEDIVILDGEGNEIDPASSDYIGTGCVIQNIYNGEVSDQLTVMITGDVNGDGEKDVFDLAKMFDHIQETLTLDGAYLGAAYINSDDEIDVFDLAELFDEIQG